MIDNKTIDDLRRKFGGPNEKKNQSFDIEKYLEKYGVQVTKVKQNGDGVLYCLDSCVFDSSHTGNESAICQKANGMLCYQCFHDSCRDKTWKQARKIISGDDKLYGNENGITEDAQFKLARYSDIALKPAEWVINGLIERDTLVSLFGDPGSGKTFVALDMAACIATGIDFHGREVQQGPVVYIAGEGQNGLKKRLMAWEIRHNQDLDQTPLFLSLTPTGLCDHKQVAFVVDAIQRIGMSPQLVVFDTVARNFGPGDENSTADMTKFIAGLDIIRSEFHTCAMSVHHTGHADKSRSRGSSALFGAIDAEYLLIEENGIIRLHNKKMKDHEKMPSMAFKFRTVELPVEDEYGCTVTSAILDDVEWQPQQHKKAGRGEWQVRSMDILERLYQEHRCNLSCGGYDSSEALVKIVDWQNACLNEGMTRSTWSRIVNNLKDNPHVEEEIGGYVRLV